MLSKRTIKKDIAKNLFLEGGGYLRDHVHVNICGFRYLRYTTVFLRVSLTDSHVGEHAEYRIANLIGHVRAIMVSINPSRVRICEAKKTNKYFNALH